MDLSILIVSYKTPALLADCLASVFAETQGLDFEVIVIDNASSDGTIEMVQARFPDVRLTALDDNVGFAAANNIAARRARGEYLVLLNPDTVVHNGALQRLYAFCRSRPDIGMCGGRTLRPDGSLDPSSCWGVPSLWSALCFATGLSTALRHHPLFDPESLGRWQRDSVREVGVVTGCLALLPRDVWRDLNGFDTSFFMYGEDIDLSMRVVRAGKRLVITPDSTITHVVGASSPPGGPKTVQVMTGRVTLMSKHWSPVQRSLGGLLLLVGVGLRAIGQRAGAPGTAPDELRWPHVWARRRQWLSGYTLPP